MKIIGFSQLHNESEKGNLEDWFRCMNALCDRTYIFDQASTDNSREIYKRNNAEVIYNKTNDFKRELVCKQVLLDTLLMENPDTDWIFWMDGDTLLDKRLLTREVTTEILKVIETVGGDGLRLGHYNLWRSDVHYRIDSEYNYFDIAGRVAFWRNNGHLRFLNKEGLHMMQEPIGMELIVPQMEYKLIHRGFATDYQLINKYKIYDEINKSDKVGFTPGLDRLLQEDNLVVKKIPTEILPVWYKIENDSNPTGLEKIKNIYNKGEK